MSEHHQVHTSAATRRRRKRRRRSETRWNLIIATAAVAGIAAAFAPAQPTGIAAFDVIERGAFAVAVTLFSACSRRWAWLILAGVATVFAASLWGHVLGAVALGFAVHAAWRTDTHDRATGALIGALSAQVLLRTDDIGFFGFTAILTALTVAIVMVSGYRTMRRRNQSRIHLALGVLALFIVIATAGFVYSAIRASNSLEFGILSAKRGLNVADKADQVGAAGYWDAANHAFSNADSFLSSPLVKIAYPVPVLAQHARLSAVAADSGRSITATAARAATIAPYQRLRASDGTFDLERISSMERPLRQTATAMISARNDVDATTTPWLISPFRDRIDDYRGQLVRAIPRAESAVQAIQAAPEVLGGNGTRHYLLLFANPAEARGLGGFIGAWAQLDAKDGHLELVRHGKMGELNDAGNPATRRITGEPEYLRRYGHLQPARFIQNISASPDFPTVARVAEQLYPQAGGVRLDGVMYVDPIALAALLKLTGPVTAEGIAKPLTAKNAANFLMHGQYLDSPDVDDRSDLLSNAAEATFKALTTRELPSIVKITNTLSPVMHSRRIMAVVNDAQANRYFASIGLTGAIPPPTKQDDFIGVRLSNGSANKADFYLKVIYAYAAYHSDATGRTRGKMYGLLRNSAPSSGEPPYVLGNQDTRAGRSDGRPFGSVTEQISIYSRLRPTTMTVGGKKVGLQVQRELGYWVTTQTVTVPPGTTVYFNLDMSGEIDPGARYQLTALLQPIAQKSGIGLVYRSTDADGKLLPLPAQRFLLDDRAVAHFRARPVPHGVR